MTPQTEPRTWVRLTITCPLQAADAVASVLASLSPNGFSIEEEDASVRLTAFAGPHRSPEAAADVGAQAREALLSVPEELLPRPLQISVEAEPEEDWLEVFRAQHRSERVGRIVVKPTWETWPGPNQRSLPGDIIVEIDPGLAFGTGQHPTTRLCLEELQDRVRPGDRVLDYGCGSGILAIAAAKLGAREVLAIDVDSAAAEVAQENVERNEVAEIVSLEVAGSLDAIEPRWDLVVANINPVIVVRETPDAVRILRPGGCYLCTGIPISREMEVLEALRAADLEIMPRPCGEWIGFVCTTRGGERR